MCVFCLCADAKTATAASHLTAVDRHRRPSMLLLNSICGPDHQSNPPTTPTYNHQIHIVSFPKHFPLFRKTNQSFQESSITSRLASPQIFFLPRTRTSLKFYWRRWLNFDFFATGNPVEAVVEKSKDIPNHLGGLKTISGPSLGISKQILTP